MPTFANTLNPTPFAVFDADVQFQSEADSMFVYVRRKLGDDLLSVEITKKQVWTNLEESVFEYGKFVNEYMTRSQLSNMLGNSTGSLTGSENRYPRETLEMLMRKAEPYATYASLGGAYNTISGSLTLSASKQDYNLYTELKDADGNLLVNHALNTPKGKMKILEVFHYDPFNSYRFFDTANPVNYLSNEFSFSTFTPETAFYVMPVFEDILRASHMKLANKVRRSNYSYQIIGTNLRMFPRPTHKTNNTKLWIRVGFANDGLKPPFEDNSLDGISNPSNIPFGNINYNAINSMGRQWIRQYCLALCREQLGDNRGKFDSIPIAGGNLTLDGSSLVSRGREDKERLRTELREMFESLTYDKLLETQAQEVDNLQKVLRAIPIPFGKAISMG